MRQFTLKGVYCPPSILEQMCQEPGGLEEAKKLDFAIFTGGPLAPATGDALSKVTSLCQIYGSTEIGVTPALVPLPQNWAYLEFHPFYGHVMEEVGQDQYEMVLYRDMTMKRFRQVCHTNPNVEVWRTKDVFKPHPTEPNLWQFQGRIDDIMVLGNGEKFNPVPIEKTVEGHPLVYGALMVGQGKELPALIIEPEKGVALDSKDLLDAIWPIIQEANSRAPGHARVNRSMVLIAKTEKPFLRAGKGTIVRKLSVAAFSDEIEKLYSEENNEVNDVPDLDPPYDQKAIQGFVQAAVKLYFPKIDLDNQSDFFVLGLDSLQTLEFVSRLKAGLRAHPNGRKCSWLSAKIVYAKPTIKALSQEIDERLKLGMESKINSGEEEAERSSRMSVIVDKYTRDILGCTSVSSRHQRDTDLTVVLTGSTGSLGTHLLEALLNDRGISTIYCMNRCRDAQERHEKNFRDRGLESSMIWAALQSTLMRQVFSVRKTPLAKFAFCKSNLELQSLASSKASSMSSRQVSTLSSTTHGKSTSCITWNRSSPSISEVCAALSSGACEVTADPISSLFLRSLLLETGLPSILVESLSRKHLTRPTTSRLNLDMESQNMCPNVSLDSRQNVVEYQRAFFVLARSLGH